MIHFNQIGSSFFLEQSLIFFVKIEKRATENEK